MASIPPLLVWLGLWLYLRNVNRKVSALEDQLRAEKQKP